ncbi:hypothetical protein CEXT_763251 [Caerostris extrusa]|uniref:Uncharacterized protein n=1 Tax=Caerostris extrusa TaxID=172846 RepID=A0AAV4XSK1_CAEEX|nr:hypothetical protein CEXT_763251 [Caerostris extrusa]
MKRINKAVWFRYLKKNQDIGGSVNIVSLRIEFLILQYFGKSHGQNQPRTFSGVLHSSARSTNTSSNLIMAIINGAALINELNDAALINKLNDAALINKLNYAAIVNLLNGAEVNELNDAKKKKYCPMLLA